MNFFLSLLPLLQTPADSLSTRFMGKIQHFISMPVEDKIQTLTDWAIEFGVKVLVCLIALWLGKKVIRFVVRFLRKIMDRRHIDTSVGYFLTNLLRAIFWVALVWILIGYLGADTTSILALFASAGLAFGLALSGTLQNFAGGVMILLFKPFRIGDYIEAQGEAGTVIDITIVNTIITTPDNKTIYLPNGATSTGVVNNYSRQPDRRVEWTFGIGYGDDYDQAKQLLMNILEEEPRILDEPAPPFIALKELGTSSVNLVVRAWVVSADYWDVFFAINERVYKSFPEVDLSMPFPQMDVYLHSSDKDHRKLTDGKKE
jgi:small conductance mechanosensitive channel